MTERTLIYHQFAGVALDNGTSVRQVAPYDLSGNQAISRSFTLSNGVEFDADGTADADVVPGTIRAVFRITGATHAAANTASLALQALLGKRSTLLGKEFSGSSWTAKSCTARCLVARPMMRAGLPMAVGKQHQIEVEMVWKRIGNGS